MRVTNAFWRKQRSAARRRADLDDHSGGYDAWSQPPDAFEDTHQEHIEQADANWRCTLPEQCQRLASAQRHDAIREAAKQAVLASVQADMGSLVPKYPCCHVRLHFSQEQEHQGRRRQQKGSKEQLQQQWNSEGPASAAATAVRSQDQAVRYAGVTNGETQLRSFGCTCCDIWSVMPEAVAPRPRPCSRRPSLQTSSSGTFTADGWGLSSVSDSLLCCSEQNEQ